MDNQPAKPHYRRIVLKLSGEALAGPEGYGIDPDQAAIIAHKIKAVHDLNVQVAVVIGAGNLWRGHTGVERGMEQAVADYMGMIGTVMNGLALQDALERIGVPSRVQTAIAMNQVAEPFIRLRAIRHLEKGRVVILAGGTGNPYFTTDTAAAMRGMDVRADVIIKGTQVDGVYTEDPKKNPHATRYEHLTYAEALERRVRVMDLTAITLAMEYNVPLIVLNIWDDHSFMDAVLGKKVGTLIVNGDDEVQK